MPRTSAVLTLNQAKAQLRARGITITRWAEQNGFRRKDVYNVLNGLVKANFGAAHSIAVALGIKPNTPDDGMGGKPARAA